MLDSTVVVGNSLKLSIEAVYIIADAVILVCIILVTHNFLILALMNDIVF